MYGRLGISIHITSVIENKNLYNVGFIMSLRLLKMTTLITSVIENGIFITSVEKMSSRLLKIPGVFLGLLKIPLII